ncbi:HesB/IscA family protein [Blastochloris viridis]|uniref:Iron binding protein SufA for iron-sulfur cluster assembly n=1 Tax=Blastochloris viridis TaxID=1079 RepID=A0A0H5BNC0_BLAVI|nr:iron-sulfur cluster assembly accessory protein [Blastochloris viridis]ALK08935.1 Iron-binding protein IscA [Blastochloris viridis]BAR97668.1 iron binding protein SufA for iron-sulfur cluster assembly [Blastochloris viridis]CUU41596.1 Iron-sulfur cluster assembly protein [Blastochloris viridis]
MTVRPKMQVLRLTDSAAAQVRQLMDATETPIVGLRVGVKKGGCAGMAYTVDYATEVRPGEEVVEQGGAKVVIEPGAIMFLLGAEMDYRTEKLSAQFVFNNPNETASCGCGESVALAPAEGAVAA